MPKAVAALLGMFLLTPLCLAQLSKDRIQELAESPKWIHLLHYKKSLWGSYSSEADGKGFFLSPDGKNNPQKELLANIEAFKREVIVESKSDEHPRCRFPLRFSWLAEQVKELASLPPIKCPLYQQFYQSMQPVGISLVFSSYYMGNPSSVFGHTFLRLHRKELPGVNKKAELLDSGINYAANPTTDNPMLYSLFGLIGMFPGTFAKLPYYYKVREYAESESRDLWSYDLNFTQKQVDDFAAHLWELGHTHFDYYFLSENCSYHVLEAIEAVNPNWDLTGALPFYVIPSETIKMLYRVPGFVKNVSFRPSARKVFIHSWEKIENSEERSNFQEIAKKQDPSLLDESLSREAKIRVLDTAIDYLDYTESAALFKEEPEALKMKNRFLAARARLGKSDGDRQVFAPDIERPHRGHDTKYFSLGGGYTDTHKGFGEIGFRFAFHDKLERLQGYPANTSIELLSFHLRSSKDHPKPYLEDFNILRIESLAPIRSFETPLAWRGGIGAQRIKEEHCNECLAWRGDFASGLAVDWGFGGVSSYVLAGVELAGSLSFYETYLRTGVGPIAGIYKQMWSWWSVGIEGSAFYHWRFPEPWQWQAKFSNRYQLSDNWDVLLEAKRFEIGQEYRIGTHIFF